MKTTQKTEFIKLEGKKTQSFRNGLKRINTGSKPKKKTIAQMTSQIAKNIVGSVSVVQFYLKSS